MFVLRPYQVKLDERIRDLVRRGRRRILLQLPTGGGKCLGKGTPVLMFDGRIVNVESVRVGDKLMGPDGLPREVIELGHGNGPLCRIVPRRGTPWICTPNHVLTLKNTTTGESVDIALDQWKNANRNFQHLHKQYGVSVDFLPTAAVPMDPYILGIWIGDGSKSLGGRSSSFIVSKPDHEIAEALAEFARRLGCEFKTRVSPGKCPSHVVVTPRGQPNHALELLRSVVGRDMKIPHVYLTASREERLQFLAGIIDTDGYIHNGSCEIAQKRRDYADAISFVARSLGFRVLVSEKIVKSTSYWRMSISGDLSVVPMRIARKKPPVRHMNKDALRTGFLVEDAGVGEWFGFTLDGDGRFLLGDFTVTHNTAVAAEIIQGAKRKGSRILFLAHRKELIDQPSKKLDELGHDHGIIKGKHWRNRPHLPIQVGSVQTLARRSKPEAKIVIIDEAHRASAKSYRKILDEYPDAVWLGLTATPWRLDGSGLGDIFEDMVMGPTIGELVADGYLVAPRVFAPYVPDLSGVRMSHGDYNQADLAAKMKGGHRVGGIVERWLEIGRGRTTICFACNVEDSKLIVAAFREVGVRAEHVDADTPEAQRDAILKRLAAGETEVVSNVNLISEGFDLPQASCAILARPTQSLSMFLQQVGRIERPSPGKTDAILLDHAGCVFAHGMPCVDRPWTLDGRDKGKRVPAGEQLRKCKACHAVLERPGPCPFCGHAVQQPLFDRMPVEHEGALVEIQSTLLCPSCGSDRVKAKASDVRFRLRVRCKECDKTSWLPDVVAAQHATKSDKKAEYRRLEEVRQRKGFSKGWTAHKYKELFGMWPRGME